MDDATKLVRELRDTAQWLAEVNRPTEQRLQEVVALMTKAADALTLEALPAAAPRDPRRCVPHGEWLGECLDCMDGGYPQTAAAAPPAPLPGPPREPDVNDGWHVMNSRAIGNSDDQDGASVVLEVHTDGDSPKVMQWLCDALNATDQGDCVIAPNPTGVQGQSTIQDSNVTDDKAERLADLNAKSLSHAGANTDDEAANLLRELIDAYGGDYESLADADRFIAAVHAARAYFAPAQHANGNCPIGAPHCPICSDLVHEKAAAAGAQGLSHAERDVVRYRWLRRFDHFAQVDAMLDTTTYSSLDAAVDAAIAKDSQ